MTTIAATSGATLESQRRDLFRDEADEEDDDAQQNQQHGGIRHVRLRRNRPRRVRGAEEERRGADRDEDSERAVDRDDFQQDEEELEAIRREVNVRRALTLRRFDRFEPHAVPRLDERERRRRWRGEAIRQQVEEF